MYVVTWLKHSRESKVVRGPPLAELSNRYMNTVARYVSSVTRCMNIVTEYMNKVVKYMDIISRMDTIAK